MLLPPPATASASLRPRGSSGERWHADSLGHRGALAQRRRGREAVRATAGALSGRHAAAVATLHDASCRQALPRTAGRAAIWMGAEMAVEGGWDIAGRSPRRAELAALVGAHRAEVDDLGHLVRARVEGAPVRLSHTAQIKRAELRRADAHSVAGAWRVGEGAVVRW